MTISALIKALQAFKDSYGDVEVVYDSRIYGSDTKVEFVTYRDTTDDEVCAEIV